MKSVQLAEIRQLAKGSKSPFAKIALELVGAIEGLTEQVAVAERRAREAEESKVSLERLLNDAGAHVSSAQALVEDLIARSAEAEEPPMPPHPDLQVGNAAIYRGSPRVVHPEEVILGRLFEILQRTPRWINPHGADEGPFNARAERQRFEPDF